MRELHASKARSSGSAGQSLPVKIYDKIAAVYNSSKGHWGQYLTRKRLNDPSITDRMISQFIRQCPCCHVMSRIHLQIKTHSFTCSSYNPFEVLHLDVKGQTIILVIIDAFSRWIELYPTMTTTAAETASCIFQHFNRSGYPDVVNTDRGTAFHNEIIEEVRREPAAVEPMKIVIDKDKWRIPCNRAPPRKHSEEKQEEIRKQVDALLDLGVIKESRATEWSQVFS